MCMSEQQLFDLGQNAIKPGLSSVAGASLPAPYGGRQRQIMIDLDPQALQSKGLSAQDVGAALAAQDQITPVGTAKLGGLEYTVKLEHEAPTCSKSSTICRSRASTSATHLYARYRPCARRLPADPMWCVYDGRRTVLMGVLKNGSASTMAIVKQVKAALPKLQEGMPSAPSASPCTATSSRCSRRGVDFFGGQGVIARGPDQPDDPGVPWQLAARPRGSSPLLIPLAVLSSIA